MTSTSRIRLSLTLATILAGYSGAALAVTDSDKEAIRALANAGAKEFDRGEYESAREKFTRAFAIAKVPRLALLAARANEKLGRLVAAYELYRQAVALERNELWLAKTQEQAQIEAKQELAALQPRLPKLTILVEGAHASDVTVTVDGDAVPGALLGIERYVDPGTHQVIGKLGDQQREQSIVVAEAAHRQAVLKFAPLASRAAVGSVPAAATTTNQPNPAEGSSSKQSPLAPRNDTSGSGNTQRTIGWVSLGVGAAGLILGTTAGVIVAAKYSDLNKNCPSRSCDSPYQSRVDSYDNWQTISTVGFIVGGVGLASGITLVLTSPKRDSNPAAALWVGPASMGVKGAF